MKHPAIIGAGGVASYLLPVLIKSFKPASITIVDKDILEERNLDRQMFSKDDIGKNKGVALHDTYVKDWLYYCKPERSNVFSVITQWFDEMTELPDDTDCIICVADNHAARHAALFYADKHKVPCIIGGNEYLDNESYIYYSTWNGTKKDPRIRYPEIVTAGDEGSPMACTGTATIASPQLAIANSGCASKILHLLWVWERFAKKEQLNKEALDALPYELFSGLSDHHAL